jgi:hypothetical protein
LFPVQNAENEFLMYAHRRELKSKTNANNEAIPVLELRTSPRVGGGQSTSRQYCANSTEKNHKTSDPRLDFWVSEHRFCSTNGRCPAVFDASICEPAPNE